MILLDHVGSLNHFESLKDVLASAVAGETVSCLQPVSSRDRLEFMGTGSNRFLCPGTLNDLESL